MRKYLRLFATGFTMGAADLVPGVSGGTVAFLLGIYEELLYSIKKVTGDCLKTAVLDRRPWKALQMVPFAFLVPLGVGILTAILSLAGFLGWALETHQSLVLAFFFGLVAASIWAVRKRVVTWNPHDYLAMAVTAVATYFFVGLVPVETSNHPLMFVLSGAIAICAMILPGISGSFLLVIMGKYQQILDAVINRDVVTLGLFMVGAAIGISIFARVLTWLFRRHHDIAIVVLTGFMIGSLREVWPWKEVLTTRLNSHGELVPLLERNLLPDLTAATTWIAVALMVVGFLFVYLLDRMQITSEQTQDVADPQFAAGHRQAVKSQASGQL